MQAAGKKQAAIYRLNRRKTTNKFFNIARAIKLKQLSAPAGLTEHSDFAASSNRVSRKQIRATNKRPTHIQYTLERSYCHFYNCR